MVIMKYSFCRRELLAGSLTLPLAARGVPLKIGVMDGVLRLSGKPAAVGAAKAAGCAGLQVTLGKATAAGKLPLEDAELQARYLAEVRKHALPINATYLDMLHADCLKSEAAARDWVLRGIEITRKLNAGILMTVFFYKCGIDNRAELERVAAVFKDVAPVAEKAGVVIGFESLLKADDNLRTLDLVGSTAFQVYYDVGNATNLTGVDAAGEIRRLGKRRICQFHFKDKGYLGEGAVDFAAVLKAIAEIGFEGYANLETGSPSGVPANDLRRNLDYLRVLMA